jgi:phosphoserine phosphatase RsbU/P
MEPSRSAILEDTSTGEAHYGVSLMVMNGPEDGRIFMISANPARLGRLDSLEVTLALDPTISRLHAQIRQDGGVYYLEDLNSKHGTELEGAKLSGKGELRDGNLIQVGETVLQFRCVPSPHSGGDCTGS